jgi:hypothetical protein
METEKQRNIYQRMFDAAGKISTLVKEHKHGQGFKFVSHDDAVRKCREAFQQCGILCVMSVEDCSVEAQGKTTLTRVMMNVEFINPDEPTDRYAVRVPAYALDQSDKGTGKAISYAKKYALIAMSGLMLATGEDVDQDNLEWAALHANSDTPKPATEAERARFMEEWNTVSEEMQLDGEWLKALAQKVNVKYQTATAEDLKRLRDAIFAELTNTQKEDTTDAA